VQQLFTQGALNNTGVSTDLSLDGDGFFVVTGTVSGTSGTFFSRAGQMSLDKDGFLVNSTGMKLQGFKANADGVGFEAALTSLQVGAATLPPRATEEFSVSANIDSTLTTPAVAWDAQNPSATSNFSTSMSVYDSLGNAHTMDVYFRKTGANAWDYHAIMDGGELTGGTPGTNVELGSGALTFNTAGALQTQTTGAAISANFAGAAAGQAIAVNFGTPVATGGTGMDGITQFASPSGISTQSQDGYAAGDLSGLSVDGLGVVRGVYTNGMKLAAGQISVAKFRSNDGLGRAGNGLFVETRDSGQAGIGTAGSGGRGAITAGTLEQSNVDLAQQFVELITHQRAFQANSKTITTADEMLQELVNLKR
jgi:flagellar hook protein FlgE